ncbi:MAG: hypothetical protein II920_07830, partial [Clostridia bacterium]|nr:hypothetical protein [Clostridia bacterium]
MKELYTVYGLVGEVISIADKGLVYKDTTIPFNSIEKVVKLGNANVKKGVIIQIFVHDYSEPIEVFYTDKNEKLT